MDDDDEVRLNKLTQEEPDAAPGFIKDSLDKILWNVLAQALGTTQGELKMIHISDDEIPASKVKWGFSSLVCCISAHPGRLDPKIIIDSDIRNYSCNCLIANYIWRLRAMTIQPIRCTTNCVKLSHTDDSVEYPFSSYHNSIIQVDRSMQHPRGVPHCDERWK